MKAIFLCNEKDRYKKVYSAKSIEILKQNADFVDKAYDEDYVKAHIDEFVDVEYIFSTWGIPSLSEEKINEIFPNLKCVFYAAGSVQDFARPFLNCGVKVFSAWAANAIPVAEYTLAQILLANKGFYATSAMMSRGEPENAMRLSKEYGGNFDRAVGIIGVGKIGEKVCEFLKEYRLLVKVFDPFLSDKKAEELGVIKCSLEEIFSTCYVVSNHLANNAQTQNIFKYELFSLLPMYATFINTGRGTQVVEDDLVRILTERLDITAVLDVTFPEPPRKGHPFYSLENCFLTPHIAGSIGNEVHRMAEYMVDEYLNYKFNRTCLYEITEKMLETMA